MEHPAPKSEVVTETQDLPLEKASPDSSATDSPEHQPAAAGSEAKPDAKHFQVNVHAASLPECREFHSLRMFSAFRLVETPLPGRCKIHLLSLRENTESKTTDHNPV